MAKSKYDVHLGIIMEMHFNGKKATEIANFLNENDKNLKAEESGLRAFIKKNLPPVPKAVSESKENQLPEDNFDSSQGKIMYLSELLDEMEKKNSLLQKEAVVQGKLLNNLENVKDEYEEIIERYSILNDTLQEAIIITKEDVSRRKLYYMIGGGWILTLLFALFAGYYIGRCYSRTAFHYILTLTALPAGILIGMALSYTKKKLS
jgi:hypothetical protein